MSADVDSPPHTIFLLLNRRPASVEIDALLMWSFVQELRRHVTDLSPIVNRTNSFLRSQYHTHEVDGFANEVWVFAANVGSHCSLANGPNASEKVLFGQVQSMYDGESCVAAMHDDEGCTMVLTRNKTAGISQESSLTVKELTSLPESGMHVLIAPLSIANCGDTIPVRAIAWNLSSPSWTKSVRLQDMSQTINDTMPFYPGGQRLLRCPFHHATCNDSETNAVSSFIVGCDLGTHVDSPKHFDPNGRSITELSFTELICPLVVVDCRSQCGDESSDYEMTAEDVHRHETEHGLIPAGALVCMRTGWSQRFHDAVRYKGGSDEAMHFPGFSLAAAQFLGNERHVAGIGIDTLSLDIGSSSDFPVHSFMLCEKGRYQVENMVLENVPPVGAIAIILPWKVEGAFEALCRAVALVPV